jgi:hypothetical protein
VTNKVPSFAVRKTGITTTTLTCCIISWLVISIMPSRKIWIAIAFSFCLLLYINWFWLHPVVGVVTSSSNYGKTLKLSKSITACLNLRGSSGKWVQDWQYANQSNYQVDTYTSWHLAAQSFTPTPEQPFRLATSWRWYDDNCPVSLVEKVGFCRVCLDLGITRILIVGDSLSAEFQRSLVSLLSHAPLGRPWNTFNGLFKPQSIPCHLDNGSSSSFTVTFLNYRRSPIGDVKALGTETQRLRNNETIKKSSQRDFVEKNPNRTAIVANIGAWIKSTEDYQEGFDSLVSWIDSFPPSKILAFYRETIPGHSGCKPHGERSQVKDYDWIHPVHEEPHANYESFSALRDERILLLNNTNTTEDFGWGLFEGFNGYSRKQIQERGDGKVRIHWLNVFNSSVLRRDGHVGFGDCLHYYMPGPTDWWAHFFYSTLRDLANEGTNNRTLES